MSSQFPTKTSRKKTANVMVGNSMRQVRLPSLGKGTAGRQPGFARGHVTTPAREAHRVSWRRERASGLHPEHAARGLRRVRLRGARPCAAAGRARPRGGGEGARRRRRRGARLRLERRARRRCARRIAERTAAREGLALAADDVLVSGGNSQALGQVLTDAHRARRRRLRRVPHLQPGARHHRRPPRRRRRRAHGRGGPRRRRARRGRRARSGRPAGARACSTPSRPSTTRPA